MPCCSTQLGTVNFLASKMTASQILGIDLGGTKVTLSLFDAKTFQSLRSTTIATEAKEGYAHVQERLLKELSQWLTPEVAAIGLGVPGFVDKKTRTIVTLPNIPGAEGADIVGWLSKESGKPVTVENDARCFAYAEAVAGAGSGHDVVIGITLGTGVGGGVVIDGELYLGSRGFAGEVGHVLLVPGQPPYKTDDKRGEAEQFLSGTAMGKRCDAATSPQQYLEGQVCSFLRPEVFREVAWLVTDLVHVIDPSIVVFGGSAGRALAPHLPMIREEVRRWMVPGVPAPELSCGSLADASVRGAALLAKKMISQK